MLAQHYNRYLSQSVHLLLSCLKIAFPDNVSLPYDLPLPDFLQTHQLDFKQYLIQADRYYIHRPKILFNSLRIRPFLKTFCYINILEKNNGFLQLGTQETSLVFEWLHIYYHQ